MYKKIKYLRGDKLRSCIYIKESAGDENGCRAIFRCICGEEFDCLIKNVKSGNTKSCGCRKNLSKHGLIKHPVYIIWANMKSRCYNKDNNSYHNYGARHIMVCDEWKTNFKKFYNYVIQLPHYMDSGMTLDRIDNEGNYEPGNVRWADRHTQKTNQRISTNSSGFTGVSKHWNKYRSTIKLNGVKIHLGLFDTIDDAVNARNEYIKTNKLFEYKPQ